MLQYSHAGKAIEGISWLQFYGGRMSRASDREERPFTGLQLRPSSSHLLSRVSSIDNYRQPSHIVGILAREENSALGYVFHQAPFSPWCHGVDAFPCGIVFVDLFRHGGLQI